MVVSDITLWLLTLAVFNYAVVYRRNKFFGSIGYLLFGFLFYAVRTEFGYTEASYGYVAMFIMLGALMNMIYEVIGRFGGSSKRLSSNS